MAPEYTDQAVAFDEAEAATLRDYREHVLAKLAESRRTSSLVDSFRALSAHDKQDAFAMLLRALLQRAQVAAPFSTSTRVVEQIFRDRLAGRTSVESDRSLSREQTHAASERVFDFYRSLTAALRPKRELVSEWDLYCVRNVSRLRALSAKVFLQQLFEASASLRPLLFARARRDHFGSELQRDDGAFPLGGYATLSNRGSLENLVPSELSMFDVKVEDGISMFDVRWFERELLYFDRDDATAPRKVRRFRFVWSDPSGLSRFRDEGARFQRLIYSFASAWLLFALGRRYLGQAAIHIDCTFEDGDFSVEAGAFEAALLPFSDRGLVSWNGSGHTWDAELRFDASSTGDSRTCSLGLPRSHEDWATWLMETARTFFR
jgi:hypothetical protein